MNAIRVVIADDHTLVRAGIRSLLTSLQGIEVVGEAGDGREALRLIRTHHPHVALLDITMPGLNGLEVAARAGKESPNTRVIMISMHANEEYVLQSLRAGAVGYLVKDADTTELELAVKAVAAGETYLSPSVSKHVISNYVRRVGTVTNRLERLTPRQREVLQLIAEGNSSKEIARLLNLGVKTVETHRTQLMQQLDIHEVAGLVRFAIGVGLVPPVS